MKPKYLYKYEIFIYLFILNNTTVYKLNVKHIHILVTFLYFHQWL